VLICLNLFLLLYSTEFCTYFQPDPCLYAHRILVPLVNQSPVPLLDFNSYSSLPLSLFYSHLDCYSSTSPYPHASTHRIFHVSICFYLQPLPCTQILLSTGSSLYPYVSIHRIFPVPRCFYPQDLLLPHSLEFMFSSNLELYRTLYIVH
jgi:hypothetical protein